MHVSRDYVSLAVDSNYPTEGVPLVIPEQEDDDSTPILRSPPSQRTKRLSYSASMIIGRNRKNAGALTTSRKATRGSEPHRRLSGSLSQEAREPHHGISRHRHYHHQWDNHGTQQAPQFPFQAGPQQTRYLSIPQPWPSSREHRFFLAPQARVPTVSRCPRQHQHAPRAFGIW
jgi:hypothetical protein